MIEVIAPFVPKNNANLPVVDSIYVKGGFMPVDSILDRNAIPSNRRSEGMMVWVADNGYSYRLGAGLTNSDWSTIGSDANAYSFTQSTPASSWVISHNLGFIPNVLTINISGVNLHGNVQHLSSNSCVVNFNKLYAGSGFFKLRGCYGIYFWSRFKFRSKPNKECCSTSFIWKYSFCSYRWASLL